MQIGANIGVATPMLITVDASASIKAEAPIEMASLTSWVASSGDALFLIPSSSGMTPSKPAQPGIQGRAGHFCW